MTLSRLKLNSINFTSQPFIYWETTSYYNERALKTISVVGGPALTKLSFHMLDFCVFNVSLARLSALELTLPRITSVHFDITPRPMHVQESRVTVETFIDLVSIWLGRMFPNLKRVGIGSEVRTLLLQPGIQALISSIQERCEMNVGGCVEIS